MSHPRKRQKLAQASAEKSGSNENTVLASLSRSITPPLTARAQRSLPRHLDLHNESQSEVEELQIHEANCEKLSHKSQERPRVIRSPIQLTRIRDLPEEKNVDTVQLRDILGDPLIRECWQFNYCFDVDFLMRQFDPDVRDLVQVKVIHGSWKQDSPNRIRIDEACHRYPNVESIVAYMPEPFGTHHSKMMVLLRHDDLARIVIHTANMLAGDWENMSQAVWQSPLLPLLPSPLNHETEMSTQFGSGARFKRDLLAYLEFYGQKKTGPLTKQLQAFDFTAICAALVASVPSKDKLHTGGSTNKTLWGWPALKNALGQIPRSDLSQRPHIVIQVSSIATLGLTDKWLKDIMFSSLCPSEIRSLAKTVQIPRYSIIFPTPDEIRRSLNGYGSGGSIHMKLQSAAQRKQLEYMRPFLCHWAGDAEEVDTKTSQVNLGDPVRAQRIDAGRRRAAPHIKTYIRFSNLNEMKTIDWAMISSANLSTQAWGAAPNSEGKVRICSWEIGVLVWPELLASDTNQLGDSRPKMVPCFGKDTPDPTQRQEDSTVVGFRMPYDLPLSPYATTDVPWCATINHEEPDWFGQKWII